MIKSTLKRIVTTPARDSNDEAVRFKIRMQQHVGGALNRPNLMVMELVPGATMLEGCPPTKAAELLDPATPAGRRRLRELGALVAMDALLNNSDRAICGMFDNDGNARNILFTPGDDGHTVAIDQACCSLDPANTISKRLVDRYHQRLDQFLTDIWATEAGSGGGGGGGGGSAEPSSPAGHIAQFLYNETVYDVGDGMQLTVQHTACCVELLQSLRRTERSSPTTPSPTTHHPPLATHHLPPTYFPHSDGRTMLLQGLREGACAVAAIPTDFFTRLKDHFASMVQTDWQNVWADGLKRIHPAFLEDAHARFAASIPEAGSVCSAMKALAEAEGGSVVKARHDKSDLSGWMAEAPLEPYNSETRTVELGVDSQVE